MFDLIDDLSSTHWEDKGSPPDDLSTVPNFKTYVNCHIVTRKPAPPPVKEISYVVADDGGKNARTVIIKGIEAKDPLKNVRHFHAILEEVAGSENVHEVKAILLDMDWCIRK